MATFDSSIDVPDAQRLEPAPPAGDLPADAPVMRLTAFQVLGTAESTFTQQCVYLMASAYQAPSVTAVTLHRALRPAGMAVEYLLYENWESGDEWRAQQDAAYRRRFEEAIAGCLAAPPVQTLYSGCYYSMGRITA